MMQDILKISNFPEFFPQPLPEQPRRSGNSRYNSAMPMTPFVERFRELGARETRSVTVPDKEALPSGEYGFFELYCNEPNCDCRRVVILVLRPQTGWKPWAVINYGWESEEFSGNGPKLPLRIAPNGRGRNSIP